MRFTSRFVPPVAVTRTYLELTSPDQFHPSRSPDPALRLEHVRDCPPALYRSLYADVGRAYHWVDRSRWTDREIRDHVARPEISVWVLHHGTDTAGYFELAGEADGSVEIAYFGLVGRFIGRGLGKHLLTCAVEQAWAMGASRVWLHTCTLDHPAALPNYLRRGFTPFKTEQYTHPQNPDS